MSSPSAETVTNHLHTLKIDPDGDGFCPFSQNADASGFAPPTPTETGLELPSSSSPPYSDDEVSTPKQCPIITTQEIDPLLIRKSLEARMAYLTDFLDFGLDDAIAISDVAPFVHSVIPGMVDGMYAKLFEFDITKKVFMQRNEGFDGELPKTLEDLTLDSPQIVFRKVFMKSWARRVLTADYTSDKTWVYMNKVGLMHTGVSPFKHQRALGIPPLNVPYRDCALMLGWVQQVLQSSILSVPESKISFEKKLTAVNAINKVIWIQNDLFSRHYIKDE
ncbi:Protoglobin-domain-containing protein [Flagelloscypha sp. PMI_526]|nr:Protoglobin-domain-containing protein [Flagelloscypha sp. PMI_526]